jgi:phospho-N-acetylmuramoyl-pentapeptide-transferase
MLKLVLACIIGFALATATGKPMIRALAALKAGQPIKDIGPTWHSNKGGTPTMGGIIFILAAIVAVAVAGFEDMQAGRFGALFVLLFGLLFACIGFVDDYLKVKKKHNDGLSSGQKFFLQVAVSIFFTILLRNFGYLSFGLYIPFVNVTLNLPPWLYMAFAAFVMVATVNAVNITDGLDGLSSGVTLPVMLLFVALSVYWGKSEVGVFAAALFGGLMGFLIYNFYPAKVFMGDTGALFMGGAVCGLAFALDVPMIIPLCGLIYVLETLSDIIQVSYFKATRGKRIFRMAPLHHHFEMGGWSEVKVFIVFTLVTIVMCVLSFFGIANRFPH